MKKESWFSSKKVSELKIKNKKKSEKVVQSKKNNDFFGNQEIKQDLQSFYNIEAKKYAETRKKFWHEEKAILDAITPLFNSLSSWTEWWILGNTRDPLSKALEWQNISPLFKDGGWKPGDFSYSWNKNPHPDKSGSSFKKEQNKKIRVLEFGCGSGRFATLLNQQFPGKFDYVWIDLSDELLSYASKENPNLTFFQWDITKLVKSFEQESFDLIVWTSSFQHIPTAKERSYLMKNFYRLLDYDGILLMTNRSLSDWFIKKHWKIVMKARILSWFKMNKWSARDLLVPRTDENWIVYERFYHFFSLEELKNLATFSGLTLKKNIFIDKDWHFTDNEKISRSSFFVSTKNPIINQ